MDLCWFKLLSFKFCGGFWQVLILVVLVDNAQTWSNVQVLELWEQDRAMKCAGSGTRVTWLQLTSLPCAGSYAAQPCLVMQPASPGPLGMCGVPTDMVKVGQSLAWWNCLLRLHLHRSWRLWRRWCVTSDDGGSRRYRFSWYVYTPSIATTVMMDVADKQRHPIAVEECSAKCLTYHHTYTPFRCWNPWLGRSSRTSCTVLATISSALLSDHYTNPCCNQSLHLPTQ